MDKAEWEDQDTWYRPNLDEALTSHFHIHEAVCRHCGKIPDLQAVINTAIWLERVRAEIFGGKVIHVNSWCRCPTHNKRVGGAEHSLHMRGWAVDITVRGISPYAAWRVLKDFQGEPPKIIGGLGRYPSFVHIDRGRARRWSGP